MSTTQFQINLHAVQSMKDDLCKRINQCWSSLGIALVQPLPQKEEMGAVMCGCFHLKHAQAVRRYDVGLFQESELVTSKRTDFKEATPFVILSKCKNSTTPRYMYIQV